MDELPLALDVEACKQTGLVWDELFMFHFPGMRSFDFWCEPGEEHWECAGGKRRLYTLLEAIGLGSKLTRIKTRDATREELTSFHTSFYLDSLIKMDTSVEPGIVAGDAGHFARFSHGGYNVALRAAGGAIEACKAVLDKNVRNAYALVRPPGHHACADKGMGFCLFNNVAVAARYVQRNSAFKRIAIVDFDVHHGNGTQEAFYDDNSVLFISIHQDSNYPRGSGQIEEIGRGEGMGYNINIPLPPGSGSGAYKATFESIVMPAVTKFKPDFIICSAGYDASYADMLGCMMLSSADFHYMSSELIAIAEASCDGRIVFAHEGGYSKDYVPFCGLGVLSALTGQKLIDDPNLDECRGWGYQSLQQHQLDTLSDIFSWHNGPGELLEGVPEPTESISDKPQVHAKRRKRQIEEV